MIFAEAIQNVHSDTPVGTWATLILGIIAAVGFQINSWRKDKRESEDRKSVQAVNIETRDVLRQIEKGQSTQNGTLSKIYDVNESHHTEMLRVLQTNCKATPVLVQQVNKEK